LRKALGKAIEVNTKSQFQLFFFKGGGARCIEVEVKEIDSREIEKHLEQGESILIRPKRKPKLIVDLVVNESVTEPWYFTHI